MPRMPRALVFAPVIDCKALLSVLDKVLTGFTEVSGQLSAQIKNTALIQCEGKNWYLFQFLDKGTSPHWIGDADVLLANKAKDFGPVWGPVWHPGTRPFDISARVVAYLNSVLQQRVSFPLLHFAGISSRSEEVPWVKFSKVVFGVLKDTVQFARTITPDAWAYVKNSYSLIVGGRKIE